MCDVCLSSPCQLRCPNAPDPPAVHICKGCCADIYEGEEYFEVLDETYCEDCVRHKTAETEY